MKSGFKIVIVQIYNIIIINCLFVCMCVFVKMSCIKNKYELSKKKFYCGNNDLFIIILGTAT